MDIGPPIGDVDDTVLVVLALPDQLRLAARERVGIVWTPGGSVDGMGGSSAAEIVGRFVGKDYASRAGIPARTQNRQGHSVLCSGGRGTKVLGY